MHDRRDGLDHRRRGVALEDVPAHVDAGRALRDRPVRHRQRVELGELLPAGHHDRHRAAGRHALEPLFDVVRLDDLGAELGAHAGGEAEVASVARQLLADGRDAEHRHPVAVARV